MKSDQIEKNQKTKQTHTFRKSFIVVAALAFAVWLVFGVTNKDLDTDSDVGNELVPEGGPDVSASPIVSDGFMSFGYRVPGFGIDAEVKLSKPGFVTAYLDTRNGQQVLIATSQLLPAGESDLITLEPAPGLTFGDTIRIYLYQDDGSGVFDEGDILLYDADGQPLFKEFVLIEPE